MTTDPSERQLRDVLHEALAHVDAAGAFRQADVPLLRAVVAETAPAWRLASHPATLFGSWSTLSPNAQAAFRSAVEREIARAMDFQPRGAVWPRLVGAWMTVHRELERRALSPAVRSLGDRWAARAWDGPARLATLAYRRHHRQRWRRGRRLTVEDLLAGLGRSPHWLLGDFVTGVRVDERCLGLHWQHDRHVLRGYLVGVDLILTDSGSWCVEANIGTAFNEERRAVLSPEPSVEALFAEASAAGARHVVWQDMDRSEVRVWLLLELHEAARRHGISVEVRESHRIPRRDDLPAGVAPPLKFTLAPDAPREHTLVVRRNSFAVGSDYFICNKAPFIRGVRRAIERGGASAVRLPEMAALAESVFVAPEPGLPNLVYKYPDLEKGEGVFFLRVDEPHEAERLAREIDRETGEPPGLFQQFICSRLLDGRRIYDVRCELLITPRGARHILSIRREAMQSLPHTLANGRVRTPGVFTSNLATGGRFAPVSPDEADQVRHAALAVGEALVDALNEAFETGVAR